MDWRKSAERILGPADIRINGKRPWDIQVHDDRLFERVLTQGTLGFGEAYIEGWWDCERIDEMVCRIIRSGIINKVSLSPSLIAVKISSTLFNMQSLNRSRKVAEKHYDLGNDLFVSMLDKNMQYSCGYWKNAKNLDQAQQNKMDLICRKLDLKPGQRLLDIGSGWGSLANYAAENYGVKVTAITISKEQNEYSKEKYSNKNVDYLLCDYRNVSGKFDRIVSVGMIEHVGYKNYRKMMKKVYDLLNDDGLFLLHTIGSNHSVISSDPWIAKYIFPNSMLPSLMQLASSFEKLLIVEDLHNFGADYDKTLMAWMKNIDKNWRRLQEKYDDRFYRMWRYYLLSCAGSFRARDIQLWQIVLSKNGIPGGYESVR